MDADKIVNYIKSNECSFVPRMFIEINGELKLVSIDVICNQVNHNEYN